MFTVEKTKPTQVTIEVGGLITQDEMSNGLDQLNALVAEMKQAQIMTIYYQIDMPEIGAIFEEFKRLPQMFGMIRQIDRVAVISDQKWVRDMAMFEGLVIPGVEIRSFPETGRDQAQAFLDGIADVTDDENFPV